MAEGIRRPRGQYAGIPEPGDNLHEVALYVARCLADDWGRSRLKRTEIQGHIGIHARNGTIVIACDSEAYGWDRIQRIKRDPEATCRGFRLIVEMRNG